MVTNAKGQSGSGKWGVSGSGGSYGGGTYKTGNKNKGSGTATGYATCCNDFNQKAASWKTLASQTKGAASCPRPTPAQLNTFGNWINKGAVVQTVTATKVNNWAKTNKMNFTKSSPASCKTVLQAKFGKTCIKAVCRNKTGSFLVATMPTVKGKTFNISKC